MILFLSKYDDLYLEQLKTSIGYALTRIPCPPNGYCGPTCGLQPFCGLLNNAYADICQEESKRNGTET